MKIQKLVNQATRAADEDDGAESGPNRRQCSLEWVSRLGILCNCAAVPWFVKQIHDINGKLVKSPANWPQEFPK
jgi:protein gp37